MMESIIILIISDSGKAIFITAKSDGTEDQHIFYAENSGGTITVTEVGVIKSVGG